MESSLLPMILGGVVILAVAVLGLVLGQGSAKAAEQRLDEMSGRRVKAKQAETTGALLRPQTFDLGNSRTLVERFFSVEALGQWYEQADVGLTVRQFLGVCGGLATAGAAISTILQLPLLLMPVCAAAMGLLPLFWLSSRRRKRINKFISQMPDAMELVGRALRAGHGLASGMRVVAEEMPPPISQEFGRVFEEQNLGIPLEEALRGLAERVPSMDVRFFVTAVVIQRATGGDLAEILDKIGRLIRERFQILGQVQALTGEGRVSGGVLLAMPPLLMAVMYALNPDYVSLLFSDEIGKKMLIATGVLQLMGAIAIKKIITIKV